jgi:predicted ATPase
MCHYHDAHTDDDPAVRMSLTLQEVSAIGYRSLRRIRFPVGRLTVFVGANGVGKTNLYRALQLLQAAAAGTLSRELATEGGMQSALWAGKRRASEPVRIALEAIFAGGGTYTVDVGLPPGKYIVELGVRMPTAAAFGDEPQVKRESLTFQHGKRIVTLLERNGASVRALTDAGERVEIERDLMASETALGAIEDPSRFTDLYQVRRALLDWRFYHDLRTDPGSPLRQPCLAVATPTLASDGNDLAAVFATLVHIREDSAELDRAFDEAFPGARLVVPIPGRRASLGVTFADHPKRVFEASELSDGTLRYLGLMGVLLAYRLPAFVALNEPEASLHPDLLDPLARLIVRAAERTQIWLVTHSERLAEAIAEHGGVQPLTVIKRDGETWIDGLTLSGAFRDQDD